MPPLWAASIRLTIASVLLVALVRAAGQRLPTGAARSAAFQFGFFNMGVQFALLYWGERRVSSGVAAVFYATIPLTTVLFARAFGLERLTGIKMAAAIGAIAGVAVIFSGELGARVEPASLVAVFLATIFGSLSGVLLKRGPKQSPLGTNAIASMAGLPICLAGSFLIGEPHPLPRHASALLPILYLVLMGSIGAYVLFAWLVQQWAVTRVSFIAVVVPIVAVILGAIVRHERLTPLTLLGSMIVMAALLLELLGDRVRMRRAKA